MVQAQSGGAGGPALSIEDAAAIRALIVEFHFLVDHGRAGDAAFVFAPDAQLVFGPGTPNPGTISGYDDIAAWLKVRETAPVVTRHLLGPTRFEVRSADEVATSTLLTLFKAPGGDNPNVPAALADLEEVFVRTADGWRELVREVRPVAWA